MGKALVLRNCKADMTSHSGFTWPKSGPVEAPDWDPKPECGHGLNGLLWGDGDWSLLRGDLDAVWQVVEVDEADLVKIDSAKVKFRKGTVVYTGEMGKAITQVLCSKIRFDLTLAEAKQKSSGDYSKAASSGDYSTAEAQGEKTIAMVAGIGGMAKTGKDGCFALAYLDKKQRPRILVGQVGEKGIKADIWYYVKNGKLVKV